MNPPLSGLFSVVTKLHGCLWLCVCLTVAALAQTTNQPSGGDENKKIQDEIKSLRRAVAHLEEQNQQLRTENQKLRRLLADQGEAPSPNPAAVAEQAGNALPPPSVDAVKTNSVDAASGNAPVYWLSKTSGKRHNLRCKYYNKPDGRFCGPNEGVPCKLCGG